MGNLTSQFFANIYLNGLDHFIKEVIRTTKYVRYVDDFALFSDDQNLLVEARGKIEEYLVKLRLKIHPIKSQLFATKYRSSFLGFRILPGRVRVRNNNLHRGRRRLRRLQQDYAIGTIEWKDVERALTSWMAHLEQGDTWQLRKQIFDSVLLS
ncbi:RNA-directed DNA polymerase [Microcystis aeruginosa]|uniref:RNA-directed DNA polymerase n=1 Tax=Microcystis aeruginosa TaxID=1126 RepID=UPI002283F634|nr:RNA-directed DNA polymerase [Microcystis aeruginosa]MDB9394443.1 RNA-directed DNA polymerase [Microcystis aeruginosa CS-573]